LDIAIHHNHHTRNPNLTWHSIDQVQLDIAYKTCHMCRKRTTLSLHPCFSIVLMFSSDRLFWYTRSVGGSLWLLIIGSKLDWLGRTILSKNNLVTLKNSL
jgi:hypothetical protein